MIASTLKPVLIISGPTAAGKSDLALDLAQSLDGEIVNVDSVQVYRGADIGSAKLSEAERRGVPHHLLDIREPGVELNVSEFCDVALEVISAIQSRGKLAILVGGTTLYIRSLLLGLADLPGPSVEFRATLKQLSTEQMHERLKGVDPALAQRLHHNDRVRIERGLEVFALTGARLSEIHDRHALAGSGLQALVLLLEPEREALYARIDARSAQLVQQGLVQETRLIMQRYGESVRVLDALGYAQARQFIAGQISEEQLVPAIAQETRRFAKRQMSFWRSEPKKRGWAVRAVESPSDLAAQVKSWLAKASSVIEVWKV